jgi:hypothetical protein
LYAGRAAATAEEGFALCEQIGWPVIVHRARQALAGLPPETVLTGLSMGASVADRHQSRRQLALARNAIRPGHIRLTWPCNF